MVGLQSVVYHVSAILHALHGRHAICTKISLQRPQPIDYNQTNNYIINPINPCAPEASRPISTLGNRMNDSKEPLCSPPLIPIENSTDSSPL